MKLSELITYRFAPNVGNADRVFRVFSGLTLAVIPWTSIVSVPDWAAIAMTVAGVAWFITGVVSRCGIYYLLGLSTRNV